MAKAKSAVNDGGSAEVLARQAEALRGVIADTEDAAQHLLSVTERVDRALDLLRGRPGLQDGAAADALDQLNDSLVVLIEGCSFQDLTGQRLERVARVLEGVSAGRGGAAEDDPFGDALLHGPQTNGAGLDQSAVDSLFD
ncbi:MAG: hypothetical protein RIB45_14385 [Marivibrio sp.]|uniref:hypothetical protein n=1 Tax=Marivibrio sp. TaxID=2039719 RepID=UPI0032EFDAF8